MWEITKIHSCYDKIGTSTLFCERTKVYFMCIKPLWQLITVPNMNKIHRFISYTSLQTYTTYEKNWHKCYILAHSQCIFYMHQVAIVGNYWTKYEQNQHSFLRYRNKHIKVMKNITIIIQIWRRAKCYFTCVSNTWYLISIPNMNKINVFFFELSQQIHKMYEKVAIIKQICYLIGMSKY